MEKRRKQVLAASFLAGAFAVTAGFAVQGHARAAQYRRMLDNTYQHAFTELATAAGELDVALRKVTYATSPELFSALCAQAYSKALAAFYAVERQKKKRYAEYRIGKLYAAGLGCEQDYGDAARWFQLSADKGYKYAQYSLAGLFRRGQGVEQDDARALELYTASAQQDFPYAAYDHIDYSKVKAVLDVEMSIPAQFVDDVAVAVKDRCPIETCLCSGGNIMSRDKVLAAVKKIMEGK